MSACADAFLTYPRSRAVGCEAKEVQRQEMGVEIEIFEAPGSGAKVRSTVAAILTISERAARADWDGHGGKPANWDSVLHAINVAKRLASDVPEPEISIDPDGEVAMEWHRAPRLVFSVSVGPRGELTYAGLFGRNKVHGLETYVADGIPRAIRDGIRRVHAAD